MKRVEDVFVLLCILFGSLFVVLLSFNVDISVIMIDWLNNELFEWVMLFEDCKFKDFNIDNEIIFKC